MRGIIITGSLSVASFATGLGFEVSGYQNIYLAYGLWAFSAILFIVTLFLWLIPKLRYKWKKEYTEIHEIEVPEELKAKVLDKPKIEGKILSIKNHVVRRKIQK